MLIPTIYLKATRYFDAFVIKQEQIYITFTSLMYKAVDTVFTAAVVYVIAGIVLVVANSIIKKKKNK